MSESADSRRTLHPSFDRRGLRLEIDGRQLRAFRSDLAPFYRALIERPEVERLFDAGLVRTWISEVEVEGFDLVLESERIPVVTYPLEWPTAVLREAGLVTARLGRALADLGLGLSDAHPWNVLFDGTRGVWIDLGSIVPMTNVSRSWVREFRSDVVLPLVLHSIGWHGLGDSMMSTFRTKNAKAHWDHRPLRYLVPPGFSRISLGARPSVAFFDKLIAYLEHLRPHGGRTKWSSYPQREGARVGDEAAYNGKQTAVEGFLKELPAGLLLDVGASRGWYSELAAQHGHRVVALDTDDLAMSALFVLARQQQLKIQPLRMDIMWPTGSHGMNLVCKGAPERLNSDVSMFLAILHHLAGQGISFEIFASTVDRFTRSAAIVEFVPRDDRYVSQWPISREPWYDLDHLIEAMAPYFTRVDVRPSSPAPRQLLLFRR
jgi:hypothetical protein